MDLERMYRDRLTTADEAVKHIQSGDYVVVQHAAGEPTTLIDAMVANREQYRGVTVAHMVAMGECPYAQPGMEPYFTHDSYFCGKSTRDAINSGRGIFTPMFQHEIPRFMKRGDIKVNVALIQVSPMDRHGYVSLGISVDYTKAAAECADLVIAEVNPHMPRTLGDSFLHISDIDFLVEVDHPLLTSTVPTLDENDKKIGEYCASLVEDGSTIQLGIGSMPDAVAYALMGKKDLGIHSELLSDAMVDLYESGAITGAKKSLHKKKIVTTFFMGTQKLYDFIDDNPVIEIYPTDYTNDPRVIARNSKMVSINATIQMDLMGQAASEMIGEKQFSGTGGQADFVRGTAMCPDGKSILCFKSTAKNGTISKIVPYLDHGAAVTVLRNDVDYAVTEYGIAKLKGKSLPERSRALISIAHPKFRDWLMEEHQRRFFHPCVL